MLRPIDRPSAGDGFPEEPHIRRAIERIDREGGRLERETIAAYERARRELLGRVLAGEDAPMSDIQNRMILPQVEDTLRQMYADLSALYGSHLMRVIQREAEQAIEDMRRLPLWQAADRALIEQQGIFAPRISTGMVRNLVETAGEKIVAVNDTVRSNIKGHLTTAMIRGDGVHPTMKRILSDGELTLDGIRPVFPSVYDRARTIARTELANAANASHLAKYVQASELLPDLLVRWSSCLCSTTCGFCRAFHNMPPRKPGELWTHTIGGRTVSVFKPTAHPCCICRLVATVRT